MKVNNALRKQQQASTIDLTRYPDCKGIRDA